MKLGRTILVILLIFSACAVVCYYNDDPWIEFDRSAYEDLVVEYGDPVPVHTISAVYRSKVFHREGIPLTVEIDPVSSDALGTFPVGYRASYEGLTASGSYRVTVVDTVPPVLTVDEDALTYSASDNCDGDLTDRVRVEEQWDRILYTVADSSGNTDACTVLKDVTPPVITLGERLLDFTCTDDRDGDLTSQVTYYESGGVFFYEVTDSSGNAATASREITGEDRVIYLTFDDGPSSLTPQLLDVLKQYGVKATFFVVGNSKYFDILPRTLAEGHAIGAHTYNHVYAKVYASVDDYFADLDRVQEKIYEQAGARTDLIRFPGGSSNTVSRNYCRGIMSRLSKLVEERGYTYFDWNVSSGDAGATTETAAVIRNVESGILSKPVSVVLQHDTKSYSVAGVEAILKWGLERGYVFLPLTSRSTTAHQGIAN